MSATIRPLRATRSRHLCTVSFEIVCSTLVKDKIEYIAELDHSAMTVDGDSSLNAIFADCPIACVSDVAGFRVVTLSNGTDGSTLRLGITYIGSEDIYAAADGYVYGSGDTDYVYVFDADGTVTLTGTRTGHLADGA